MNQPVLNRFLSRDPLPPDGQPDILYDNNWFGDRMTWMRNTYGYASNNPVNRVDPSGLQDERPDPIVPILFCWVQLDPCKPCQDILAKWRPKSDFEYSPPTLDRERKRKCIAKVKCAKSCPNGLLGYSGPPVRTGAREFTIDICISCSVAESSVKTVIEHELVHFKRFCTQLRGIRNCEDCKRDEGAAYKESCKVAFPNDEQKRERCEKCGVFLGCQHFNTDNLNNQCVKDLAKSCSPADLGVGIVGQ